MTEREKMLAGQLYDCGDAELLNQWHKAKDLIRDYNGTDSADTEVKKRIKPEMYSLSTLIFVTVLLLLFLVNKTPAEQKKKKLQMQQQGGKV